MCNCARNSEYCKRESCEYHEHAESIHIHRLFSCSSGYFACCTEENDCAIERKSIIPQLVYVAMANGSRQNIRHK